MALVLSEAGVDIRLTIDDRLEVLESTFEDYGRGRAVSRPRTHTYTPLGEKAFYNFTSMDGTVPRLGVHALRLSSEVVRDTKVFGHAWGETSPSRPVAGIKWNEQPALGKLDAGVAHGCQDKDTITCFNNIGLGITFGAVEVRVMELAREQGPRRKIPI